MTGVGIEPTTNGLTYRCAVRINSFPPEDERTRLRAHGRDDAPCFSVVTCRSTEEHSMPVSRTEASPPAHKRPSTATENATGVLPVALSADPDLAAVIGAWDRLPEAVRAGIVAMVKAAAAG
jgi:hypothetical protein